MEDPNGYPPAVSLHLHLSSSLSLSLWHAIVRRLHPQSRGHVILLPRATPSRGFAGASAAPHAPAVNCEASSRASPADIVSMTNVDRHQQSKSWTSPCTSQSVAVFVKTRFAWESQQSLSQQPNTFAGQESSASTSPCNQSSAVGWSVSFSPSLSLCLSPCDVVLCCVVVIIVCVCVCACGVVVVWCSWCCVVVCVCVCCAVCVVCMWTCCRRVAGTHGDVLNRHTEACWDLHAAVFSVPHRMKLLTSSYPEGNCRGNQL